MDAKEARAKQEANAKHRQQAETQRKAQQQAAREERIADIVKKEAPFQMKRVEAEIAVAVKAGKCSTQVLMNANEGGYEVLMAIQAELLKLGYHVRYNYYSGEAGRAAYDEMDTPACYDMTVVW